MDYHYLDWCRITNNGRTFITRRNERGIWQENSITKGELNITIKPTAKPYEEYKKYLVSTLHFLAIFDFYG
jgi:hypothetical protein